MIPERIWNNPYYDLETERVYIKGKDSSSFIMKRLIYPGIDPTVYYIGSNGHIFNRIICSEIKIYINSRFKNKPWVRLTTVDENKNAYLNDYELLDVIAYNFIRNPKHYLSRNCKADFLDNLSRRIDFWNVVYSD